MLERHLKECSAKRGFGEREIGNVLGFFGDDRRRRVLVGVGGKQIVLDVKRGQVAGVSL